MTVRVYRWDDVDAPQLSATAGDLIGLLDSVLVNGYGSNSPAGWTKAYAGVNQAGYTNAGSGCGVLFRNTTLATTATFVGYESIDVDGVMTNQFPTVAQMPNGVYCGIAYTANTTEHPWVVVADSKRFYLWVGQSMATSSGLASLGPQPMIFVGDIISRLSTDLYPFLVIGGNTTTASSNFMGNLRGAPFSGSTAHYMARAYTQAVGSVEMAKLANYSLMNQNTLGTTGFTYPDPLSGGMTLAPIFLSEVLNSLWRGILPGLWNPMHTLPGNSGDTFTGTGELAGRTFLLLDVSNAGTRGRAALEISDTWG